jgi:hypothetical protein
MLCAPLLRIHDDGSNGADRPRTAVRVRIAFRIGGGRAREPCRVGHLLTSERHTVRASSPSDAGRLGGGASVAWRCQELPMVAAAFWTASCAVVAGRPMSFTRSSLAVNSSPRARPASASATAAAVFGGSPAAVRALV